MRRRAERRDDAEPGIISVLESIGATVERWDKVDLIVGFRRRTFLLEVKTPGRQRKKGRRQAQTDDRQSEFRRRWAGHYEIVETPQDALRAIGAG